MTDITAKVNLTVTYTIHSADYFVVGQSQNPITSPPSHERHVVNSNYKYTRSASKTLVPYLTPVLLAYLTTLINSRLQRQLTTTIVVTH